MPGPAPRILTIDDFLPPSLLGDLVDHAIGSEAAFQPSLVQGARHEPLIRNSLHCDVGLGALKGAFKQAIHARLDEFFVAVGVSPFAVSRTELELVAHGNGNFYQGHIDTVTDDERLQSNADRTISAVYYFHHEPKAFSGGELAVFRFGSREVSQIIEPKQNRLIVFPSFVMHEVRVVSCPSGTFADSRFAINCWLHRARD